MASDKPQVECPDPECKGPVVSFRSQFYRECQKCGTRWDWELKEGQRPLIKYTR